MKQSHDKASHLQEWLQEVYEYVASFLVLVYSNCNF